jgi:hypothetical protein
MEISRRNILLTGVAFLAACGSDGPPPPPPPPAPEVRVPFSFAAGTDGFAAAFADYSPGMESGAQGIAFVSEFRRLPPPLDNRFGLLLGGTDRPDDLFMYISRTVTGLIPGQRYRVQVEITFATNAPAGCVGPGAPGESLYIKAGATGTQPVKAVQDGRVVTNLDKGNSSNSGRELIVIGDFTGGGGTCGQREYRLKTLSTAAPQPLVPPNPAPPDALIVTADGNGRLWIVIGTDAGNEIRTEIYYLEGAATFSPV